MKMKTMNRTMLRSIGAAAVALALAACNSPQSPEGAKPADSSAASADLAEVRAIAKEAYIYGFPMVDSYRIIYAYNINRNGPIPPTPFNQLKNNARVYTPDDKTVQTPNSDTPYSSVSMDLRAEPLVPTIPAVDKGRYFSVQLIDLYTHNYAYLGTRATGNDGGSFLIAGPRWKGEKPRGVKAVIETETELAKATYRTQLFNPDDMENVKRVQAGYKVQTLSEFLGQPAPAPAPAIEYVKALTPDEQKTSLEFFKVLNFILQFCPTHSSEKDLMARFAKIGVGAGKKFDPSTMSPEVRKAVEDGMADAWKAFADLQKRVDAKEVTSGDLFGTREFLKNNYLYRMARVATDPQSLKRSLISAYCLFVVNA